MIESSDLSEGYVLTVQVRTDAARIAASTLASNSVILADDLGEAIPKLAAKIERYIQYGQTS